MKKAKISKRPLGKVKIVYTDAPLPKNFGKLEDDTPPCRITNKLVNPNYADSIEILRKTIEVVGIEHLIFDLAQEIVMLKRSMEELKNGKKN